MTGALVARALRARDGLPDLRPSSREASAHGRAILATLDATPEERAAVERALAAVEAFDDPDDDT